jgi:hypothetical protein
MISAIPWIELPRFMDYARRMELVGDLNPLIERHVMARVREYLETFRVVVMNGPRQSGKTTLLELLHADLGGRLTSLDRPGEYAGARSDPIGFVQQPGRPLFIDEVQRGGDPLVRAVKVAVDADRRRGQFVLSGSSRFLTVPNLSESLAGRAGVVDIWPLSVAERVGHPPDFLAKVLTEPQDLMATDSAGMTRHEYMQLVCMGGFPEATQLRSARARSHWYGSYITTVTQRDVQDLASVRKAELLPRLLQKLAALTAQELNVSDLARGLDIDVQTLRTYLALFETTYLIHRLPAWSGNMLTRAKHRPKIHLADSGLAAHLVDQSADALARPGNPAADGLLETFVVNELLKIRDSGDQEAAIYHFRDRDQREVDVLMEARDGRVVGAEVKASGSVDARDFRHLSYLRDRLGSRFVAGVVLYTGSSPLPFGDRMMALPIDLLWGGASPGLA